MAKIIMLALLRTLVVMIFAAWTVLWFLKPTNIWTKKWRAVEDKMQTTIFKYNGADFVVYTFPIILLAMVGYVYLYFQPRASIRRRVGRYTTAVFNPLIVKTPLGMLSGIDVLAMSLVLALLVWTFYSRISNDYKKLVPAKPLKLKIWQLKFLKMSTRFGLLAEICLALLVFPILRGLSILRLFGIQFEASVRYHIWLGTSLVFFATLHGGGTLFIWGINHYIQNEMWEWQKQGRIYLAGLIALLTALIIWVSSLPFVRRRKFDVFFYIHHLYVIFIAFFLFHAGDRHFYMVFPGVFLFGLDKLLRVIQSSPQTHILSLRIFPSKIIELTLPKDPRLKYAPTSIIFIKIPMISKFHWHPFSITSSSSVDDETMSIMIKCEGSWTNSLYNMLCREVESLSQRNCIPVALEGPYGPASFDFIRYDNLLLIAGGIGITPILSILQEISSAKGSSRDKFPSKLHLIYVTKKSQDISLLNPISHLFLNKFCHLKLRVFVTQENKGSSSITELLNEFSTERTILFDIKTSNYTLRQQTTLSSKDPVISGSEELRTYAVFPQGPKNPLWVAAITGFSALIFLLSLCFFNQFLFEPTKKSSKSKSPSTIVDLFLLCSFVIAIACSAVVGMVLRWRNLRRGIVSNQGNGDEAMKLSSMEGTRALEEHEIYYGGRPIFKEILRKLESEFGGSNVGVVVCGPESMKESVALACKQRCQPLKLNSNKHQPFYVFHALNFSL